MLDLKGKNIIVGVTGSIAVYKTIELIRSITKSGGNVRVVQTEASKHFVGSITFETLTLNKVYSGMFDSKPASEIDHIALSDWGDVLVIAPATANIIAKAAVGIADDLLSTLIVTFNKQIIIAPAMNVRMLLNPVTIKNINELKVREVRFVEPAEGWLACGQTGKGRLAEPSDIYDKLLEVLTCKDDYKGKKVLITAGRTEEMIDPVRIITNRATGKMGLELARAAHLRGADVTLVLGPTFIKPPVFIKTFDVVTAQQMYDRVSSEFDNCDILIMTAAVTDFTPVNYQSTKLKKANKVLNLNLQPTTDILKSFVERKGKKKFVGFALETDNEIENGCKKLDEKSLDLLVVNNPLEDGAGFGVDTNLVSLIAKSGKIEELPLMLKSELADLILDRLSEIE